MIATEYNVVQRREDLELENGVAYHLRCEVDEKQHIIRIGVIDEGIQAITITGATPFMGHPKRDICCPDDINRFLISAVAILLGALKELDKGSEEQGEDLNGLWVGEIARTAIAKATS